jgi:hypothetical protein
VGFGSVILVSRLFGEDGCGIAPSRYAGSLGEDVVAAIGDLAQFHNGFHPDCGRQRESDTRTLY